MTFAILPPIDDLSHRALAAIGEQFPDLKPELAENEVDARRILAEADAAFGFLPENLLKAAPRIRWLQNPLSGPPAGFYYPTLIEHPIVITSTRGIFNDHISTQVMGYVLNFARNLPTYIRSQVRAAWEPSPLEEASVIHLPETTMLVVGLGGIGAQTAKLAAAFGMRVIAVDAKTTEPTAGVEAVWSPDHLLDVARQADFIVVTVPETPDTVGLFDADFFDAMKAGGIFINVGRGATTRLEDLVSALKSGHLGGAALDVYEIEPLPGDHPLWAMTNVILTPHTAWCGPYLDDRRLEILLRNCRAFLKGEPLFNVVDKPMWC